MQAAEGNRNRVIGITVATATGGAVAIFAVILAFYVIPSHQPLQPTRGFYVIYYGPLVDNEGKMTSQAEKILETKPSFAVVDYSAQKDKQAVTSLFKQFHDAGIKVLTYTWTKYGTRNLDDVKSDINGQLAVGADGIMVDEVTNVASEKDFAYYSTIYNTIKDKNETKLVVMNPGHFEVSESIMKISDIVSFEEDWVYSDQITWKEHYPTSRFMGVSSNEYCNPPCVSGLNAENKTVAAWNMGIGYHFATDKYTDLPSWYDSYASQIERLASSKA